MAHQTNMKYAATGQRYNSREDLATKRTCPTIQVWKSFVLMINFPKQWLSMNEENLKLM